jgi:hypothetical protein
LRSNCPPDIVSKCTSTQRLVHRHAELPESALAPLLEAIAPARLGPAPTTIRIPDLCSGLLRRSLVVTAGSTGRADRVLSVSGADDHPLQRGTDRRWPVDEPSAKRMSAHFDALVKSLALLDWIPEEAARWQGSA